MMLATGAVSVWTPPTQAAGVVAWALPDGAWAWSDGTPMTWPDGTYITWS